MTHVDQIMTMRVVMRAVRRSLFWYFICSHWMPSVPAHLLFRKLLNSSRTSWMVGGDSSTQAVTFSGMTCGKSSGFCNSGWGTHGRGPKCCRKCSVNFSGAIINFWDAFAMFLFLRIRNSSSTLRSSAHWLILLAMFLKCSVFNF